MTKYLIEDYTNNSYSGDLLDDVSRVLAAFKKESNPLVKKSWTISSRFTEEPTRLLSIVFDSEFNGYKITIKYK